MNSPERRNWGNNCSVLVHWADPSTRAPVWARWDCWALAAAPAGGCAPLHFERRRRQMPSADNEPLRQWAWRHSHRSTAGRASWRSGACHGWPLCVRGSYHWLRRLWLASERHHDLSQCQALNLWRRSLLAWRLHVGAGGRKEKTTIRIWQLNVTTPAPPHRSNAKENKLSVLPVHSGGTTGRYPVTNTLA